MYLLTAVEAMIFTANMLGAVVKAQPQKLPRHSVLKGNMNTRECKCCDDHREGCAEVASRPAQDMSVPALRVSAAPSAKLLQKQHTCHGTPNSMLFQASVPILGCVSMIETHVSSELRLEATTC